MKPQIVVLWHERSNVLATFNIKESGLPLLHILEDDYKGINPFYGYPLSWLITQVGWKVIGEL